MFSFQPVFNLYVSHSKFIKTTTSPFYSSLPKSSPVPEDRLCSHIILPPAHQSQSTVLINTYLDLCNRDFVFSSAPLSPISTPNTILLTKFSAKCHFSVRILASHPHHQLGHVQTQSSLFLRPGFILYLASYLHFLIMLWPLTIPFHSSGIH